MVPRIRKDNSFFHNWAIRWNGVPEDFSDATDVNLTAIVIGQYKKLERGTHYRIDGNIIKIDCTPSICNRVGVYKLELKYKKPNSDFIDGQRRSAVDLNAFEIVPDSEHADVTQDISATSDAIAGFALKYEHLTPEQKEELRGKGIKSLTKTSESNEEKTYTITFDDGVTFDFIVKDGHSPAITFNGTSIVVDEEIGPDLKGDTGNGISSVEFVEKVGLIKKYVITFTDGNTTDFYVRDGADGHSPVITFNGTSIVVDGQVGPNLKGETGKGVSSVTLHSTVGLSKTYRITFTDNTTFDYIVMDGPAGAGATVEQERSQALDKVPSSKLFDDETSALSREIVQLAGNVNYRKINFVTDAATTRKQIPLAERRAGMTIVYTTAKGIVTEQYNKTVYSDAEWAAEHNWYKVLDSRNLDVLIGINELKTIVGKNLYNRNNGIVGGSLQNNTGIPTINASFHYSNYIQISDSKKYILSGFKSNTILFNRVVVFYDAYGKILDTGWSTTGKQYSLASVDNDTYPVNRTFYILAPASQVPADWKTNGLATLPIPAGAAYLRFNTGYSGYDWRPYLMLEETTTSEPSAYEKYGVPSSNINYTSFENSLREITIENLLVTNKFDVTKRKINRYLSYLDATEKIQSDIEGKSFAISDYIPVFGGKTYYLSGRFVNAPETGDATGLVFYDDLGNPIKPIDINGNSYPSYRLPYLNGVVYAPIDAVSVRFTCMYYSTLQEISELQFINSSEPQEYIPFGSFIIASKSGNPVLVNNTVLDGLIMLKSGNTYTGLRVEDIKILKSIVDEIYVLNDFTAGAKAKYQNYEIEYSHVLPLNGIAMTSDGVLVFMQNGVRYNINLTQA